MRRRVWCEMLTHAEIAAQAVLRALAKRNIGALVAVFPGKHDDLFALVRKARDAGVPLAIWPMLADEAGRWASLENAPRFAAYARGLVEEMEKNGCHPEEIALDLEPPITKLKSLVSLRPSAPKHARSEDPSIFKDLVLELQARGIRVSAAVMPFLLLDHRPGFEELFGTPISAIPWDHASVMVYTSLVEGYSRGLLARKDVLPLLAASCRAAKERFGEIAGASLGAVGKGALGDEATYRSVEELREDVAIARRAGIDDLTLFDLGGALRRPPMEAWLDALVETEPAKEEPAWTLRSRAAIGAGLVIARALGAAERWTR